MAKILEQGHRKGGNRKSSKKNKKVKSSSSKRQTIQDMSDSDANEIAHDQYGRPIGKQASSHKMMAMSSS